MLCLPSPAGTPVNPGVCSLRLCPHNSDGRDPGAGKETEYLG